MADTDNNPETAQDSTWIPLPTKTAPDPSYPGAHSAISFAAAEVLRRSLGDRITFEVTSESLAGTTRHFTSFSEAAEEAGLSRIYAGQHFRFDHLAGERLGRQVARSVLSTTLQPRRDHDFD
jgi:membrane-associated phospholipid phosphatase